MIERMSRGEFGGLYHVVPERSISKYELLRLFNKVLRDGELEIVPDDSVVMDKSLVGSENVKKNMNIPSYEEMVGELRKWMWEKRELYSEIYRVSSAS